VLVERGHEVHLVAQFGCIHPDFMPMIDKLGVHWYCGQYNDRLATTNPFDIVSLLQSQYFHVAFLYLWFWYSFSVPEVYIDTLRLFAPQCAITVVTDDAHGERGHRLQVTFQDYPYLRALHSKHFNVQETLNIRRRELSIYRYVDVVATLTESDQEILDADLSTIGTLSHVLHWGTNITKAPIPRPQDLPSFADRTGIVFVGFAANPTNRLSMEWFFTFVYPLLSPEMKQVPITLVGNAPEDEFKLLKNPAQATYKLTGLLSHQELHDVLRQSKLMFSPIVTSTGLNTKNIVGLWSGLPVVTTPAGASGLRWSGQEDLYKASMSIAELVPQAYADALHDAYFNEERWTALQRGALALANAQEASHQFDKDVVSLLELVEGHKVYSSKRPSTHFFSAHYMQLKSLRSRWGGEDAQAEANKKEL
jgi:hypothetical protein